jgi:hypothetical protein
MPIRVLVSWQSFRKYFPEFLNISGVGEATTLAISSPPPSNASVAGLSLHPITFKIQDFSGVASMQRNVVIRVRIVPKMLRQTRHDHSAIVLNLISMFFAHKFLQRTPIIQRNDLVLRGCHHFWDITCVWRDHYKRNQSVQIWRK